MAFFNLFNNRNNHTKEPDNLPVSTLDQIPESAHSEPISTRFTIDWPRIGGTVEDLIATTWVKVFVDSSFIKSSAFDNFSKAWHTRRIPPFATRFYFISACEMQKLSEVERSRLLAEDYRERPGDSISTCFAKMTEQGLQWNIALLTTDGDIGYNVQAVARAKGLKLRWYGMDNGGRLCAIVQQQPAEMISNTQKAPIVSRPFKPATEPASIGRSVRIPNRVPTTGDKVLTGRDGATLCLKEAVMSDHISVTYSTSHTRFFAKVYTADVLQLDMLQNKANRMLQEKIGITGVCWPVDTINDNSGYFVGILVPASKGVQLTRSAFNGVTGISQFFPKWNKRDLCVLTVTILDKICKMHDLGLLFGCINPASIYIVGTGDVYFVDTDCWQIEGYPALSRNQTFAPPELLRDNKTKMLYSIDQENYQIALLTFMMMMPGKFPYAKGKNTNELDSIKDMAFPFSVGSSMRSSYDAERPSGIWRIVWDHLSYRICDSFYNTFHSSGKYSSPGYRLKGTDWLEMAKDFSELLANSNRTDSLSLFPRTFRRDGKRVFVRCNICGQEHPDFYFMHRIKIQQEKIDIWERGYRICLPCAGDQSDVSFKCECCSRQFYYTNKTKIVHEIGKSDFDFKNQKWCRDCKKRTVKCGHCGQETPIYQIKEFEDRLRNLRTNVCGNCFKGMIEQSKREKEEWKNAVDHWVPCRSCGKRFPVTNGDIEYYNRKRHDQPTHCPNCRKKRY